MRCNPLGLALATASALALLCSSCGSSGIGASGRIGKQSLNLENFDGVEATNAFVVDLRQDKDFRVEIEADEAFLPYLDATIRGNHLVLSMRQSLDLAGGEVRATITMPVLKTAKASGASRVMLDDFSSEDPLEIEASGASRVEGDLNTGDVHIAASGASNVKLSGRGNNLRAIASGASHIDLGDFKGRDTSAIASGASTIRVFAKGRLDAIASGASHITYLGNPILGDINDSGASSIKPD